MAQSNIPTIQFYGEGESTAMLDLLHCEPLITRTRAHKFTIRPHRHSALSQIFYLQAGSGEANLDGATTRVEGPCIMVISPMCVHDFIWSEDVSGTVISISNVLLDELKLSASIDKPVIQSTFIMPVNNGCAQLEAMLQLIQFEYNQSLAEGRAQALVSLVTLLAIWLERHAIQHSYSKGHQDRKSEYLSRFSAMINRDYLEQRKVESYAKELGITAPYLNSLCQRLVDSSALQLIHQRLLLEAKRHLIYTVMSVSEIAYALGFNDPAYFNRFFKRLCGQTPKQFRTQAIREDKT
ncbi:MAG: helix-turn-helix domain-containing protein [Oceanospirillaceae bacterium]|nr:helix-turn-helix domain-containing protein [Oceanospirillaceae bacterium]